MPVIVVDRRQASDLLFGRVRLTGTGIGREGTARHVSVNDATRSEWARYSFCGTTSRSHWFVR